MFKLYSYSFRLPFTTRALSLLPALAQERGFWIDRRGDHCTVVGLGRTLLYVDWQEGGPLLRYFA